MASSIFIPLKTIFDDSGIKKAQKSFSKLGGSLKATLGAFGVGVGLGALVTGLQATSKAYAADAKSAAILANQLRNVTGATDEQIASVEKSITSLELLSGVADDHIRPSFATLVRSTNDIAKATELTSLALDIAAGTGKDVETVAMALGKAYNGNTAQLQRLVPAVKTANDKMGYLKDTFSGAAALASNTDPYTKISVAFDHIAEAVGSAVIPTINAFADWLVEITPAIEQFFKNLNDPTTPTGKAWAELGQVVSNFGLAFSSIDGYISGSSLFKNILNGVTSLIAGFSELIFMVSDFGTTMGLAFTGQFDKIIERGTFFDRYNKFIDKMNSQLAQTGAANQNKTKAYVAPNLTAGLNFGTTGTTTAKKTQAQIDAEKAKAAFDKATEALDGFKADLKDLAAGIMPITELGREIGKFEQATIDGFDAITEKLQKGILDKTVAEKGAKALIEYAKTEKVALSAIARQRDDLAAKRSLAEALIGDVKTAIVGLGNITANEVKQIEQTVSKTVNGLTIATKKTITEALSPTTIVGNLKSVVEKTKTFATQLKQLRALGLDQNLYKQIVDSGTEAGSQTAAAIIQGGAGTVGELNSLFADLNATGATIAEETAQVMYGAGVDVTQGLIAGLASQEAALVAQAQALADAFNSAYQARLTGLEVAVPQLPAGDQNAVVPKASKQVTVKNNITVKTGTGVSTKKTAQEIQKILIKSGNSSGNSWVNYINK